MMYDLEFMECDTCRAKPGTPALCEGCLHNRDVINKLNNHLKTLPEKIRNFLKTAGYEIKWEVVK